MSDDTIKAGEQISVLVRRAHASHDFTPPEDGPELCRVCSLKRADAVARHPCAGDGDKTSEACRNKFDHGPLRGFPIPGQGGQP
jgi:hypothetical protein